MRFIAACTVCCALLVGPAAAQTPGGTSAESANLDAKLKSAAKVDVQNGKLSDVIDSLRKTSGARVVVELGKLKEAGIDLEQPLTLKLADVPLQDILDIVCRIAAGKSPMAWSVGEKAIFVSTKDDLDAKTSSRTYAVAGLSLGSKPATAQDVAELVKAMLPGAGEQVNAAPGGKNVLIVTSWSGHRQVEKLLALVRQGMTAKEWSSLYAPLKALKDPKTQKDYRWNEAPLKDCLDEISKAAGVPVFLESSAGLPAEIKVRAAVNGSTALVALDTILKTALRGPSSPVLDTAGGAAVLVTSAECSRHLVAFTVSPVAIKKLGAAKIEDLPEVVQRNIDPPSWQAGAKAAAVGPNRLLCLQTLANLQKIGELLGDAACQAATK